VYIVNMFPDDKRDMRTPGSALFPMARAPNACMEDPPQKIGWWRHGDSQQGLPQPTAAPQKDRGWIHSIDTNDGGCGTRPFAALPGISSWKHAFLRESSLQVCPSFTCHHCLRHETSGWHSFVASTAGSPDLWREHWSRQDHLLDSALPSFPEEAPESAVCEASLYWTLGRGR
jgi:hypothetical protein